MLQGTLDDVALADVINMLGAARRTGRITVRWGEERGEIFVRDGQPYYARSTTCRPLLGQKLLEMGAIDREVLREALATQAVTGQRLGQVLLAFGSVTPDQVEAAVSSQIADALRDLLTWRRGEFVWEAGLSTELVVDLGGAPARSSEDDPFEPRPRDVLMLSPESPDSVDFFEIDDEQWQAASLANGRRTYAEILELAHPDPARAREIVLGLLAKGVLAVDDEVIVLTNTEQAPPRAIHPVGAAVLEVPVGPAGPTPGGGDGNPAAPSQPRPERAAPQDPEGPAGALEPDGPAEPRQPEPAPAVLPDPHRDAPVLPGTLAGTERPDEPADGGDAAPEVSSPVPAGADEPARSGDDGVAQPPPSHPGPDEPVGALCGNEVAPHAWEKTQSPGMEEAAPPQPEVALPDGPEGILPAEPKEASPREVEGPPALEAEGDTPPEGAGALPPGAEEVAPPGPEGTLPSKAEGAPAPARRPRLFAVPRWGRGRPDPAFGDGHSGGVPGPDALPPANGLDPHADDGTIPDARPRRSSADSSTPEVPTERTGAETLGAAPPADPGLLPVDPPVPAASAWGPGTGTVETDPQAKVEANPQDPAPAPPADRTSRAVDGRVREGADPAPPRPPAAFARGARLSLSDLARQQSPGSPQRRPAPDVSPSAPPQTPPPSASGSPADAGEMAGPLHLHLDRSALARELSALVRGDVPGADWGA